MIEVTPRFRWSSVLFSLVLLSPLLWIPGSGYEGIRLPIVLGLVTLLLARRTYRAMRGQIRRGGPAPLLLAAWLFVGANVLSLAGARSPGEAMGPLLVLFAGVALFAVVRSGAVAREFALEGVPILVSIVGLALASVGIVQTAFRMDAVSTEGNTNYSGALAGILLPAALAFAFRGRGRLQSALSGVSAGALFVLLILSKSRGGWVGAVMGALLVAGTLLWRRSPGARWAGLAALVLLVLPLVQKGREQVSESGSGSVTFRLEAWKGAARMVAARPVLGVGVGNFAVEYPPYRSEAEFRASHAFVREGDFKEVEDAHSLWVQAAVETGALGLLGLLLVVYVAARLWRYYAKSAGDPETVAFLAGAGGGAAAFLVAGFFNTLSSHLSHTLLFWSFLGLIERAGRREEKIRRPAGAWGVAMPLGGALAGLFAVAMAWTMMLADREFTLGMTFADPAKRAPHLELAAQGLPAPWKAYYELALARTAMNQPVQAAEAGRAAIRLRPHYVAALNNLAASILRSKGDEAEAERDLRHASEVAPCYYLSHFNLGSLELRRKDYAAARSEFELAVKYHERHAFSQFSLGETCALLGDVESSLRHFRRARELGMQVAGILREEEPRLAADPRFAEFFR